MSRRNPQTELEFGSDSFLDIIANIVGILIILIVIAGVRVSQAPVVAAVVEEQPAEVEPEIVVEEEEPQAEEEPAVVETVPLPEEPPAEPSPSFSELRAEELKKLKLLKAERDRLNRELAAAAADMNTATEDASRWKQYDKQLQTELRAVQEAIVAKTDGTQARNEQLEVAIALLKDKKDVVKKLEVEVDSAEKSKPPVKELKHRLTPLSQTVHGKEMHFRLSGNRVAAVPLEELLARLRSQVERQKSWLMKFPRHQGTVGPVDGFSMSYAVVRQRMSIIEEMRQGQAMMRIGVEKWQIEPEENVPGETVTEALQRGSQFYRRLLMADANTTLTFWVYPDSFGLYRQLQEFAHREGFTVAARPLPEGVPIAGSPNGSRSAGQ